MASHAHLSAKVMRAPRATFSDVDVDGTASGWWFYFNFTAPRVTFNDN